MTVLVDGELQSHVRTFRKTVAFDGSAGNGAVGTVTVGTVTGEVFIHSVTAFCTENLAGATATLSLGGATGGVDGIVAVTTATDLDASEFWTSATPTAGLVDTPDAMMGFTMAEDIDVNVLVANITDGTIEFTIVYEPVSTDGNIS